MNKKVKITIVVGIIIVILMLIPTTSNAVLQANGKSTKTDALSNWLRNIRGMEADGGTLGLTDTINGTSLISSAATSNDLDIHMQLNTEYGAMVILSASSYGNKDKIEDGSTTTGNKSGVYMYPSTKTEFVAAASTLLWDGQVFSNANYKYKNNYPQNNSTTITGDAIDIGNWHGGTTIRIHICMG